MMPRVDATFWGARVVNPWFTEGVGEQAGALLPPPSLNSFTILPHCAGKTSPRHGMTSRAPQTSSPQHL